MQHLNIPQPVSSRVGVTSARRRSTQTLNGCVDPGNLIRVSNFRFRFVKLPVTDLSRSAAWYRDVLDLRRQFEFAEHGEVRGVQLVDATGDVMIALRDRRYCADQPRLAGFDVVSFRATSRDTWTLYIARSDPGCRTQQARSSS